jgi:hypothetical protein
MVFTFTADQVNDQIDNGLGVMNIQFAGFGNVIVT